MLVITYRFLTNKVPKQEGKGCPFPKIWTILPSRLEPIMFGGGCFGNVCNKALGRQIMNKDKDFILILKHTIINTMPFIFSEKKY